MICEKCKSPRPEKGQCQGCKKLYMKEYRLKNKKKIAISQREWYQNNREEVITRSVEYYEINKDVLSPKRKLYRENHKKEKVERDRQRRLHEPAYKLRQNVSVRIRDAMKGNKNNLSILKYLPYTMEELRHHLENQFDSRMTWLNYGIYWHIDHIIPQSKLPYTSMEDDNFKKCWALDNLRPLEAVANMKKYNKIIGGK